jgi:hypothetical protein
VFSQPLRQRGKKKRKGKKKGKKERRKEKKNKKRKKAISIGTAQQASAWFAHVLFTCGFV